jgi:hypothetical protein
VGVFSFQNPKNSKILLDALKELQGFPYGHPAKSRSPEVPSQTCVTVPIPLLGLPLRPGQKENLHGEDFVS